MPDPGPFGDTRFVARTLAIVDAFCLNNPGGGCVESVLTPAIHFLFLLEALLGGATKPPKLLPPGKGAGRTIGIDAGSGLQLPRRPNRDYFLRGTLAPAFRAFDKPMAMACFRLVTLPPLPPRPDRSVPCFLRRIALRTLLPAALPNLGIDSPVSFAL
jgi:hypothetical protein